MRRPSGTESGTNSRSWWSPAVRWVQATTAECCSVPTAAIRRAPSSRWWHCVAANRELRAHIDWTSVAMRGMTPRSCPGPGGRGECVADWGGGGQGARGWGQGLRSTVRQRCRDALGGRGAHYLHLYALHPPSSWSTEGGRGNFVWGQLRRKIFRRGRFQHTSNFGVGTNQLQKRSHAIQQIRQGLHCRSLDTQIRVCQSLFGTPNPTPKFLGFRWGAPGGLLRASGLQGLLRGGSSQNSLGDTSIEQY